MLNAGQIVKREHGGRIAVRLKDPSKKICPGCHSVFAREEFAGQGLCGQCKRSVETHRYVMKAETNGQEGFGFESDREHPATCYCRECRWRNEAEELTRMLKEAGCNRRVIPARQPNELYCCTYAVLVNRNLLIAIRRQENFRKITEAVLSESSSLSIEDRKMFAVIRRVQRESDSYASADC
jgi:hypothetical protein